MLRRILIALVFMCLLVTVTGSPAVAAEKNINNDGFDDIFLTYRYDNNTTALWTLTSSGWLFNMANVWASPPGGWDGARSTSAIGNFSGDSRADVAILYDYRNAQSAIWIFETTDTGYVPRVFWTSNAWDASRSKLSSGNFTGGAFDDLAILYDYGNALSGAWVFTSNGVNLSNHLAWTSGAGAWDASRSKLASGNFSGTNHEDLAILYDYNNSSSGTWIFESNGTDFSPHLAWVSAPGGWDSSRSKLTAGNFSGTAYDDLAVLYDYRNTSSGAWILESNGTFFSPHLAWVSAPGAWAWTRTRLAGGATFIPRYNLAVAKSIDINLSTQTLICYENSLAEVEEGVYSWSGSAVFSTLVSSGRPPFNTPAGYFAVYAKDPVVDMSGFGGTSEYYYVPNVPYVLWFYGNYSIHGAYWHNDFGNVRSHGCVNIPVGAAAWIYGWAPIGTPVNVHY